MRKGAPNYWKNKYRELLEKHVRLGEAILQAIKNIEPKKKTKPPKTTPPANSHERSQF
jgi:hypothetical protein